MANPIDQRTVQIKLKELKTFIDTNQVAVETAATDIANADYSSVGSPLTDDSIWQAFVSIILSMANMAIVSSDPRDVRSVEVKFKQLQALILHNEVILSAGPVLGAGTMALAIQALEDQDYSNEAEDTLNLDANWTLLKGVLNGLADRC